MRQFHWRTFKNLKHDQKIVYINNCGKFCDVILETIKPNIAQKMCVEIQSIIIGQEDWGWYLEFQKDGIFYELDINYQERDAENALEFGVALDAWKKEKGFIFERKIPAEAQLQNFTEKLILIAEKNEIEISEE